MLDQSRIFEERQRNVAYNLRQLQSILSLREPYMKRTHSSLCTLFGFVILSNAAFSQGAQQSPSPSTDTTGSPAATTPVQANQGMLTDNQIHGVVSVANQGEIDVAKIALKQGKDKSVKDFANMMVKEHGKVKKELMGLAKTAKMKNDDSPTKKTFEEAGQASMSRLKAMKGMEFDKAYAEDQVKMHQDLLNALDTELIPSAKDAKLKGLLEKIKPSVAAHLDQAKSISEKLSAQM
jgi:putative membrane protein